MSHSELGTHPQVRDAEEIGPPSPTARPARHTWTAALALLGALACAGCLDVGDKRAEADALVGQASVGGARITVQDGLAALRRFTPGDVLLWGQAPRLRWTLHTDAAARTWRFEARNIVRDAQLTWQTAADRSAGRAPQVVPRTAVADVPPTYVTTATWSLDLPADTELVFTLAAPDGDAVRPFHFIVFADVQEAIAGVQDLYEAMNLEDGPEFCLISGDLTMNGTAAEFDRFERELQRLRLPCFATLGNHDVADEDTAWHRRFGRGNFSFVHRGTRFTLLDSASATLSPKVWPWLDSWLAAGRTQPHLVMMHIPPLDRDGARSGAFASRAEAHQLLTKLAAAGVDLTLYGHVHTYASYTNAGIPAHISGGGGSIPMQLDGIGRHFLNIAVRPKDQRFSVAVVRVYPE